MNWFINTNYWQPIDNNFINNKKEEMKMKKVPKVGRPKLKLTREERKMREERRREYARNYAKLYRKENKEKVAAMYRDWYKKNKHKIHLQRAKRRQALKRKQNKAKK